jgi:predicted chitinase
MSRIRIVGGTITKTTTGAHHMYSEENIVFNSGKTITEVGEENGIIFGEPKDPPQIKSIIEKVEPYKCINCEEEINSELLRKTMGIKKLSSQQVEIIDSILPYLNKYRKDFGLDNCLRKAHFVSQIALESANFTTFEEGEVYSSTISLGIFSSSSIEINSTIINSLKDKLISIIKITDSKGIELIKTNEELKSILLTEKPTIIDGEFYGSYKGEKDKKEKKKRNDKLLKEVLKPDKTVDYKIYLKPHSYFGLQLMSRAYAPYTGDSRGLGNGDELSRDGWKFKGRGLKQVTGRGNYESFAKYRNKNTFTDDTSGAIDFTKEKEGVALKGNYLKLSDDAMYATQSALWFWNDGTKYNKKLAKEHADNDDVTSVSKAINRYDTKALPKREANYNRARKEDAFNINSHYKLMLENGNDKEKKDAKKYLDERKKSGDKDAIKIIDEYEKNNPK